MRSLLQILLAAPLAVHAAEGSNPLATIGGDLTILHNEPIQVKAEDNVCAVRVGDKLVFIDKCEFEYRPEVIANIRRKSSDGDEIQILVIQRSPMGNACNGGPIFVVELSRKNDAIISPNLDFCGGADPVITQNSKGLLITFPGGSPNRGSGKVPTERWQYQGGAFLRVR